MTTEKAPGQQQRPDRTGKQVFPVVAAVIFVVSAGLWWLVLQAEQTVPDTTTLIIGSIILILAFMGGELFPLQIEVRRETLLVSGSELPMVLGLLLLPAWVVGVTSLVAGAIVFLGRRDSFRNIAVNLSFIAIETGTAAARHAGDRRTPAARSGCGTSAAAVGVLAGALMSALAVGLTYRLLGPAEPLRRVIGRSMLSAAAIVTFGLVGYTVWISGPAGPLLCLALAVVLAVLYRTYFLFLRQHSDLTRMYTFARLVTGVGKLTDDWRDIVEQMRDQLNAEVGVLRLFDGDVEFRTLAIGPDGEIDEPPAAADDPLLATARAMGQARASTDRNIAPALLAALQARRCWDVLVIPLRSGDRDRGFLEVRDRLSRWGRFRDDDLQILETLSGHVATALDNLRLLETLRHEAYHDAVTGLRNRLGLTVEAQAQINAGREVAIVLVELDVLSQVNNALGHDRGEQLLRAAGDRLVDFAGENTPVARIEADRFAVLIDDQTEAELTAVGGQLLTVLERPYSLDGIEVDPQPFVGIAGAGDDPHDSLAPVTRDPSTLLQRAEMAMLAARGHQEALQIYRASMGEVYRRRFQLVTQFRQAIEQGRIVVHYQPKIRLADRELIGVESLVRWMHPEFGLVSPAEFVEAIEATGSIDILLEHVLDIVLQQLRSWMDDGLRISAAVNLSVRNLLARGLPVQRRAGPAAHQRAGRAADVRDHRVQRHGRPRALVAGAASAALDGHRAVRRRLRHRVFVAGLPAPAADRRDQDRPIVRPGHGHRPRRPRDRAGDRGSRALARAARRRRGCRGGGRPRRAARDEVRPGAGLPDLPADAARPVPGLARVADRQHLRPVVHPPRAAADELTARPASDRPGARARRRW